MWLVQWVESVRQLTSHIFHPVEYKTRKFGASIRRQHVAAAAWYTIFMVVKYNVLMHD